MSYMKIIMSLRSAKADHAAGVTDRLGMGKEGSDLGR